MKYNFESISTANITSRTENMLSTFSDNQQPVTTLIEYDLRRSQNTLKYLLKLKL